MSLGLSFGVGGLSQSPCPYVSQHVLQSVGPLPFSLSVRLSARPSERGASPVPLVTTSLGRLSGRGASFVPPDTTSLSAASSA
jgi:hypothetical protein